MADYQADERAVNTLRDHAFPLTGGTADFDPLMDLIGDARLVLLGEASHGTHEFYYARAQITQRLIAEKGFAAVAVEADWPDAYRVNRYVRAASDDPFAIDALAGFRRFPTWMWRNTEVVEFIDWLRAHNESQPADSTKAGFYGLDLYSLRSSMDEVLRYLDKVDPAGAEQARQRYGCFDRIDAEEQVYGFLTASGLSPSCQNEVVEQLVEFERKSLEYARRDGRIAEDEAFFAKQNARLVKNAEHYYRAMYLSDVSSWNIRDAHMADSLEAIEEHLERQRPPAKIAVWAHNSHLGDARATQMGLRGELNLGQLARQRRPGQTVLVGFTTHHGTVTAASEWGGIAERKIVRPALAKSYEMLFHEVAHEPFMLDLRDRSMSAELRQPRLERAIGVIYRPETERLSHYFRARLAEQFDAVLHFDETRAVEPLERTSQWIAGEVPETYPFAV